MKTNYQYHTLESALKTFTEFEKNHLKMMIDDYKNSTNNCRIDLRFDSPESKKESLMILEKLRQLRTSLKSKTVLWGRVRATNRKSFSNYPSDALYLNEETIKSKYTHTLSVYLKNQDYEKQFYNSNEYKKLTVL